MQHVFIIGCKGIPSSYGGFETFVDKLTEYHQNNPEIKYHVACKNSQSNEFEYHNARCFGINVPNIGASQAIYYDVMALNTCIKYCHMNPSIKEPIFYVLACRIGPFIKYFKKRIHGLNGSLYINPDGKEWERGKWSLPIRKYWKYSEFSMVKHADLLICDSLAIEKYIHNEYQQFNPKTVYAAYGSDLHPSKLHDDDPMLLKWYDEKGIQNKSYYLIVGRFVPENSFEIMIREFIKSQSKRSLVIITTLNDRFQKELDKKLQFGNDLRINFVGTVYDQELLKKIRENAYAYLHGHTVGGTNPSLIESLGSTNLNLLIDVEFNREVAGDSALYWNKKNGNLAKLIDQVDHMSPSEIEHFGKKAKKRISENYTWKEISNTYSKIFKRKKD